MHRDKSYEIARIQQEMLKGISGEYLNMLANALKCKYMNILAFLRFVNILFAYLWYSCFIILNLSWYSWHPRQMDKRMLLVFLAHFPCKELWKMEFAMDFPPFLDIFAAFQCIWKLYVHIPVAY